MSTLKKGDAIGEYSVLFVIKQSSYAETFIVVDRAKNRFFLKLINCAKLDRKQLNDSGEVVECEIAKQLDHPNLCRCILSDNVIIGSMKYVYIIFENIVGETLSEKISREQSLSVFDAKQIILGVLNGVKYCHNLATPIIHNELTIQNVMLDMSRKEFVPKIIDFGHSEFANSQSGKFLLDDMNLFYVAPEALNGFSIPQSDVFSVGAMLYHLIFGMPPWFVDMSRYSKGDNNLLDVISQERRKPLSIPNLDIFELDEYLIKVLTKATAPNIDDRFSSIEEFAKALDGEMEMCASSTAKSAPTNEPKPKYIKVGNGFADIAGMQSLKEQLRFDVIDLLENPEEYKKHNLSLPNGILLYGPPGCGKTFFAEKFAEEAGYNFQKVVNSDIASIYVHGAQEKIRKIFDEAREKAPTILYFDEINSMVPSRDSSNLQSGAAGEVNEFLSQLDNCGNDGVFVIASTNYPNQIDSAVLRAGRLEQQYYISPPDLEARRAMFELYLKNRPTDFGLDYTQMAEMTENYVASDIKFLIDKASRATIKERLGVITQKLIVQIIKISKPTVSLDEIRKHEAIHNKLMGIEKQPQRKRIGF